MEMASAYATIANQGTHIEPYMIEKVSKPGRPGAAPEHFPATYIATTPPVAYVLTHMMEGVIDHGTAYDIHDLPIDIAGKTGTTDDYSDAWFIGFTPHYTILTWIGYDAKRSLGSGMSGAVAALPMWRAIAEDGLATGWLKKGDTFQVPPGVLVRDIEYYSGLLSGARGPGDQGGVRRRHRAQPAVQLAVVDDRQPAVVPAEVPSISRRKARTCRTRPPPVPAPNRRPSRPPPPRGRRRHRRSRRHRRGQG